MVSFDVSWHYNRYFITQVAGSVGSKVAYMRRLATRIGINIATTLEDYSITRYRKAN